MYQLRLLKSTYNSKEYKTVHRLLNFEESSGNATGVEETGFVKIIREGFNTGPTRS